MLPKYPNGTLKNFISTFEIFRTFLKSVRLTIQVFTEFLQDAIQDQFSEQCTACLNSAFFLPDLLSDQG